MSNIALKKRLPPDIANDLMAYVGCIAGAISFEEYQNELAKAGFSGVHIVESGDDLNAYGQVENQAGCCSPAVVDGLPVISSCSTGLHGELSDLISRYDINDFAASVKVYAVRPA